MKLLRRSAGIVFLAAAAIAALLAYPEPLYAHHAQSGRLHLYSDRPFVDTRARAVLADVERRLALAPPREPSPTTPPTKSPTPSSANAPAPSATGAWKNGSAKASPITSASAAKSISTR